MIKAPPFFLIPPPSSIAVGVSGGPDSIALLHMLCQQTPSSTKIHALIVDHDLRPESKTEALHVFNTIKKWHNVIPYILKWEGEKPETGRLEAARNARFCLLQEYCEAHSIPELYLAHHMDDQAETFLFRLAKGSGLDGLAGMKEQKELTPDLLLKRPLLNIMKQDLLDYCEEHKLPYIKDPSNENASYMRPRLRESRQILEREGLTNQRLSTTAKRLLRARTALEEMTETAWTENHAVSASLLTLNLTGLMAHPEEIRIRILQKSIDFFSSEKRYPPRLEKVERLYEAIFHGDKFTQSTLAGLLFKQKKGKNGIFLHIQSE